VASDNFTRNLRLCMIPRAQHSYLSPIRPEPRSRQKISDLFHFSSAFPSQTFFRSSAPRSSSIVDSKPNREVLFVPRLLPSPPSFYSLTQLALKSHNSLLIPHTKKFRALPFLRDSILLELFTFSRKLTAFPPPLR